MANPDAWDRARSFLKDHIRQEIDFRSTDQSKGLPAPPIEKPCLPDAKHIPLPPRSEWTHVGPVDLVDAISRRQSHRRFRADPLHLDELAFLLWATQGVRKRVNAGTALRTVPSAGARHAFETYVCASRVATLDPAIYRYLPLEHELVAVTTVADLPERLTAGTLGQMFVVQAAAVMVWTAIPYRMEWRYGLASHKVMTLDAGHVCQNLYLACEAIAAGTCAVAAYDQDAMDQLVAVDGKDEFVVYLAPVGKV